MALRSRLHRARGPLLGILVFVAALALWELWARATGSFGVPRATEVAEHAWELWPTRDFLEEVVVSLRRLALGLAAGTAVGIAVGLLMGSSALARRTLEPLVELLRATPVIALVPALLVVLGPGETMLVAIIAFGSCFPVLIGTLEGVRSVSPEARDTASMLHVGRVERVSRVYFPAALPSTVAGVRVAVSIGLVLVVIAEFFGDGRGLGAYINAQRGLFDPPAMYAGILFLGLLGYALNRLFLLLETRILSWHYGAVGESAR